MNPIEHIISQRTLVGASQSWTISDYEKAADAKFAAFTAGSPHLSAFVMIAKDGTSVDLVSYGEPSDPEGSYKLASAAYDATVNAPGQVWYLALYNASAPAPSRVDETYLGGLSVTTVKKGPIWPWIAGVGTAALFFFGLGRKKQS